MLSLPPTRYILPNVFTLGATFCGFASIWLATQADSGPAFYVAASLICVAVFLDGLDGRIARWVDGASKFGGQLDSLSDFLTFGVAPAMLVYAWGLRPAGVFGLVVAFVLAAGAMIRLARFNVEAEETGGCSRYFTGLPAPMGGMAVALLVGVNAGVADNVDVAPAAVVSLSVFVILISLLMVSTIPFRTFKDVRPTWSNRLMIAGILATMVVVSIQLDFLAALSMGLVGYFLVNAASGVLHGARTVRVRTGRESVLDDDE